MFCRVRLLGVVTWVIGDHEWFHYLSPSSSCRCKENSFLRKWISKPRAHRRNITVKYCTKSVFAKYIAQQTNSNSLGKRVLTAKPEPAILHNRFLSLNVMLVGWLKISSHFVHWLLFQLVDPAFHIIGSKGVKLAFLRLGPYGTLY